MEQNQEAPNSAAKKKKKHRIWPFILMAVIVLAAAAVVIRGSRFSRRDVTVQSAYLSEKAQTRDIVKTLSGSGTLNPADSYTVMTLIAGNILTADFEEGDVVEKDDVLYEVDASDAAGNIEKAEISLSQAQRGYSNAVDKQYIRANASGILYSLNVNVGDTVTQGQQIAEIRDSAVMLLKLPFPADDAVNFYAGEPAEVTLDGSFETVWGWVSEVSGADIVGAGNMLTRNVTIAVENPGAISDTQYASASVGGVFCSGSAAFSYNASGTVTSGSSGTVTAIYIPEGAPVSVDTAILALGGKDISEQIRSAEDSLRNAQLSVDSTRNQLDNYTISSPIRGTVVDKQVKAGDKVAANKTLCVIYDMSWLEMTLSVDELDINSVAVGQKARVTADAVEGKEYEGVVTRISVAGTTTNGTTSYPVTIRLDETEGLLPGMNADAEITISRASGALSIPNAAVSRGNAVLVTADSPSAANALPREAPEGYVYVEVSTGVSDDDYVEITSGLTAEDTVAYVPPAAEDDDMMFMMRPGGPGGGPGGGGF